MAAPAAALPSFSSAGSSWDASAWLRAFATATHPRTLNPDHIKALRQSVWASTSGAVARGEYFTNGAVVKLNDAGEFDALHQDTVFYQSTEEERMKVPAHKRGVYRTRVTVQEGDCLEAAQQLLDEARREQAASNAAAGSSAQDSAAAAAACSVAVLNMASDRTPGGGVSGGAGAQEENLFRRSTLLRSLYQFAPFASQYGVNPCAIQRPKYLLGFPSGGVYSPPTAVFRSSEATGYALLAQPYSVAFLTVPAVRQRVKSPSLTSSQRTEMIVRIRAVLRIAAVHDHTDLVLSAFGCGAFGNPPAEIAALFHTALTKEPEFQGVFRRIVFAIFDDHNANKQHNPDGNVQPFVKAFAAYTQQQQQRAQAAPSASIAAPPQPAAAAAATVAASPLTQALSSSGQASRFQ